MILRFSGRLPERPTNHLSGNFADSSLYLPFHSAQRFRGGKGAYLIQSGLNPASAISFVLPGIGSRASCFNRGGLFIGDPSSFRPSMVARSKRKPNAVIRNPITETFQNHLLYHRMIAVQCTPAAAEIVIGTIWRKHIIDIIVKTFEEIYKGPIFHFLLLYG